MKAGRLQELQQLLFTLSHRVPKHQQIKFDPRGAARANCLYRVPACHVASWQRILFDCWKAPRAPAAPFQGFHNKPHRAKRGHLKPGKSPTFHGLQANPHKASRLHLTPGGLQEPQPLFRIPPHQAAQGQGTTFHAWRSSRVPARSCAHTKQHRASELGLSPGQSRKTQRPFLMAFAPGNIGQTDHLCETVYI